LFRMAKHWTACWQLCKTLASMTSQFIIQIKQRNYGWSCSQPGGADRVFALKEQAIQFAQTQCAGVSAEIRICDRDGVEQRWICGPGEQQLIRACQGMRAEDIDRSIISFAASANR
jgi:hypothetical protein